MTRPLAPYGLSLVSVAAAVAAKALIETWTEPGPPLIFFIPAVTLSAWYGGAGPGLFAVAVSSLVCSYLFFPPLGSWMVNSRNDVVRLALFAAIGSLISLLMERLHSAVRVSRQAADEARRLRDQVSESQKHLQDLIDNFDQVIHIKDLKGQYLFVNRAFERLFGCSRGEVAGKTTSQLLPLEVSRELEAVDSAVLATGKAVSSEDCIPYGDAMRLFATTKFPLYGGDGAPYAVGGHSIDITERRLAEDELRRQRDFAERLIEVEPVLVLVLDRDGRIVRVNPCLERVTQYSSAELWETDWFAGFIPESHRPAAREQFEAVLHNAEGQAFQCPVIMRGGQQREVEWTFRMLHESSRDGPHVLAVGHDLTDLREAQERSIQMERLATIGQMMASLAHESRNCLQRSQACLEMLSWRLSNQPEVLSLLDRIEQAQDELCHLFDDLRNHAAPIVLECTSLSLREALNEAWSQLEPARAGRQALLREQGVDNPTCHGDRLRITQVFRNILANALEACKDPVLIDVSWTACELAGKPALCITMQNNGPLVSPEQRQRFFDPFFTTKPRGTGLGMPIVRRIVEAHGGRFELGPEESERFTLLVRLPRGQT